MPLAPSLLILNKISSDKQSEDTRSDFAAGRILFRILFHLVLSSFEVPVVSLLVLVWQESCVM